MHVSNKQYSAIVFGVALAAMLLVTRLRYCGAFDVPKVPAKPEITSTNAQDVSKRVGLSSAAYRNYLKTDAEAFGISLVSEQQMAAVFPYEIDDTSHQLAPGDSVEILGLTLSASVESVPGAAFKQMMLTIENTGHRALAYRIASDVSGGRSGCARTRQVRHNALAVPASGTIKRAECVFSNGATLTISEVGVMTIPKLAFHYLSSLDPKDLMLDERTSGMHVVPHGIAPCRVPQPGNFLNALRDGLIEWHDHADFYARHRCQSYSMPMDYKAFQQDGEHRLPFGGADL